MKLHKLVSLSLVSIGLSIGCGGTVPTPAEPEASERRPPREGPTADEPPVAEADATPAETSEGQPAAEPAPALHDTKLVREDPIPWPWIRSLFAGEDAAKGLEPSHDLYDPFLVDLDGDGQEELVILYLYGQSMDGHMQGTVARKTRLGWQELITTGYNYIAVENLPGGLVGVRLEEGCTNDFRLMVLQRGRGQLSQIYPDRSLDTYEGPVSCTDESGYTYEPEPNIKRIHAKRNGLEVLEEIREEWGCPGSPRPVIYRVEDLLRRAKLLPASGGQ